MLTAATVWSLAVHDTDGDWLNGHLGHLQVFSTDCNFLASIKPGDVIVSMSDRRDASNRPQAEAIIIRSLNSGDHLDLYRARVVVPHSCRAPMKILTGGVSWGDPNRCTDDMLVQRAGLPSQIDARGIVAFRAAITRLQVFLTTYARELREGSA